MNGLARLVVGLIAGAAIGFVFYRLALPEVAASAPKNMETLIVSLWTLSGGLIGFFR